LVLAALSCSAQAQQYPSQPVRVIVTTVPGPLDAFARAVVMRMQEHLKQPFVVENKPGAAGNVGADYVAKSRPDGYTLLFSIDTTFTVNPSLYKQMPFNVDKDFDVIGTPVIYSQMLAVNPKVPAKNLAEFIKLAKTEHLSYASGGNGSPSHLTMAALLAATGLDMTHVPYKGTGASVVDVISGQVNSVFAVVSGVWPQVKAGSLRALGVSGNVRSPSAPDVPTIAEQGVPGFNASFSYVLAAPAGTPPQVLKTLADELALAMKSPEVTDLDHRSDYTPTGFDPAQSTKWVRETRAQWADVIHKANIKIE
jgi:tripartite-type tricarboxylate transporter receptor subunit TctC